MNTIVKGTEVTSTMSFWLTLFTNEITNTSTDTNLHFLLGNRIFNPSQSAPEFRFYPSLAISSIFTLKYCL